MANSPARGRPIARLVLSAQERAYLERQVRRHRVARSLSERCRKPQSFNPHQILEQMQHPRIG